MPIQRFHNLIFRRQRLIQVTALAFLAIALVLAVRMLPAEAMLRQLTAAVGALGAWGFLLFGLFAVLGTMVLLPATPITLAAGALFGPVQGAIIIFLSFLASSVLSFLGGRYLGHNLAARQLARYPRLGAVYRSLGGQGAWKVVMAVRFSHALPFGLQNVLFGATPLRFGPFLTGTALGVLPGSVLYSFLGHLGSTVFESTGEGVSLGPLGWAVRLGGLLLGVLALLYVGRMARKVILAEEGTDDPLTAPLEAELDLVAGQKRWSAYQAWGHVALLALSACVLAVAAWSYAEVVHG